jgi:hypothetical protein
MSVSLKFHDCNFFRKVIEVQAGKERVYVRIIEDDDYINNIHVTLDKVTAIKLSKELRKQIALLD